MIAALVALAIAPRIETDRAWHRLGTFAIEGEPRYESLVFGEDGSTAFSIPGKGNYRFDPRARRVKPFAPGGEWFLQADCGVGLFTVFRHRRGDPKAAPEGFLDTYRVTDGKRLSSVPAKWGSFSRHGGILGVTEASAPEQSWSDRWTNWFDARTGKKVGRTQHLDVVWDSPRARLLMGDRDYGQQEPRLPPYKTLYRAAPGRLATVAKVNVGPLEQGFKGFLGDPESGPFGLEFSFVGVGVENFSSTVVRADFSALARQVPKVWDVSRQGVLASLVDNGYPTPRGKERYPDLVCLDAWSGKTLWQQKGRSGTPAWVGRFAALMAPSEWRLLDPKTGNVARRLASPGVPIASFSDLFAFRQGGRHQPVKLSVWRLRSTSLKG